MNFKIKDNFRNFILLKGEKALRKFEKVIANYSLIPDKPFFDTSEFQWISELENNWQIMRQELDIILQNLNSIPNFQDISPDQYSITNDNLWKTFFLYAYGLKAHYNCQKCPQTTSLIEKIPGMKTAFFSILLPNKHIPEHKGPYKGVLRYHLALKVPQPNNSCLIRVGNEIRHWQEGKSLLFDDTFPHEAWNNGNDIRVVLFLDIIRPLAFPLSLINRGLIKLISISPYVQKGKNNLEKWSK